MKKTKNAKGITLIALIITIIVLLILAGITLSTLAGRRGIINQAQNAEKEHTKASALEDITLVTYQSLDNKGNTDTAKLEQGLNDIGATIKNKTENKWTVEQNGYEFEIDIETADVTEANESTGSYGGIYSEPGLEGKIAPEDLFVYEIIDEGTTASLATNSLPEKEARIVRIKPEYCNGRGMDPETGYTIYNDTNYSIIYNGNTISDILVIPYQVEINGELYKITEVGLAFTRKSSDQFGASFPKVKTIVYPNTVKTLKGGGAWSAISESEVVETIILPNSITEIKDRVFDKCPNLTITVEAGSKLTFEDFENAGIDKNRVIFK